MRAAFLGRSLNLDAHKLAVATIVVGLDEAFDLDLFENPVSIQKARRVALVPPDTLHHLQSTGRMLFLYLDPLSVDYRALDTALIDRLDAKAGPVVSELKEATETHQNAADFVVTVSQMFELPEPPVADARIARTLRAIDQTPQDFVSIEQAAEFAGISVSRFQHIFKDETGTTFRRYRLWKRMAVVARCLSDGRDLTDAAFEAGFASSSHLSASFKDMFGIRPSDLASLSVELRV